MLNLKDAVPEGTLTRLVPSARFEEVAHNVKAWKEYKASQVPPLCLFVWDEMVHRGRVKDPYKIAPVVNKEYRGIYEFVQKELGVAPVKAAYSVDIFGADPEYAFANVSLVRCFPSDIHICDVEFSDLSRPIPSDDPSAAYRPYRSLHVFNEFLERLSEVARSQGVRRLSLMVAHPPLYDVFSRHGFEVSPTDRAQAAFEGVRAGFPMIRTL